MYFRILFAVLGMLLFLAAFVHAISEDEATTEILNRIMEQQGATRPGEVDPRQVAPADLEELGYFVMGAVVDDPGWHEWMNEMMGGRGSPRLTAMHIRFAERYLEQDGALPEWNHTIMAPGMTSGMWTRWFSRAWRILCGPVGSWISLLLITILAIVIVVVRRRSR